MGVLSGVLRSRVRPGEHRRGAVHAAKALAACALASAAATGFAAGPAALPDAQAAGTARLTVFGFAVYDARLWVGAGFRQASFGQHPFALELRYLRAFKAQDIARRSIEEMRRAGSFDAAQAQRWEGLLAQLLPDVQPGDRILGVHQPGKGAQFHHNGKPIGEIADAQFARLFFAIWLGPATSEPGLREALLAGTAP